MTFVHELKQRLEENREKLASGWLKNVQRCLCNLRGVDIRDAGWKVAVVDAISFLQGSIIPLLRMKSILLNY